MKRASACAAPLLVTLALQLGIPALASAERWDPGDVAAAEKFQREESERAAEYRRRVARGDVRSASAPMPRSAPEARRNPSGGEALRDAADVVERLERWLEGSAREAEAESDRARQ
ncbi:MAG TPA: hypothetical protein VFT98_21310, partial [Myxococcota bacterium]|nr:hypothetical protein [Myxococcota bacterium]